MSEKYYKSKTTVFAYSLTILCLCIVLFSVFAFSASASGTNNLKTICELNLRSSASTSSTVVTVIPSGATVTLTKDSSSGWAKVKYSSYTGYCSTAYLNPTSDSGITMSGKTTSEVNLRSGKGTSYSSLAVVPSSSTVSVVDNSDEDWAKVTYSSKTGYIKKDYLTISFKLYKETETTATQVQPTESALPNYSNLPSWYSYSLTDTLLKNENTSLHKFMLDKSSVKLDINGTYKLTAFVSSSVPVMEHVSFSSSNTTVVTVSDSGVLTGKKAGTATITATDLVTQAKATCTVTVSSTQVPIVTPTEKPTSSETNPPTQKPTTTVTVAPTVKPTTKPTEKPTEKPTVPSTEKPTTGTETLTLSETELRLYVGTQHILKATSNATVTWSSSDTSVATVTDGIVTFVSEGTATITAKTSTKTAKCEVTAVAQKISINASHSSATVTAGKTFFASSSTDSVTWSSSDTSIATVNNGYIYGVSHGQAIISIYKKGGTRTILVTVEKAAPIRFAYTSPNCAPKNTDVTLVAVTDKTRTDVRFRVADGDTTNTVYATSKKAEGSTYVWKATYKFTTAGTYKVKAHSKLDSKWTTCDDALTTAFVVSTTDEDTTVCTQRRVSDRLINVIATYEGYMPSVYEDALTGDPTLGYGKVVYVGQQFYNNLTKTEAYAYLSQTVNNEGYTSKTNSFLIDNNVRFNQQQFDALVCFIYNTGTGIFSNDSEFRNALLDCNSSSTTTTTVYYINGSGVRLRKGPGTSYDIIKELSYGTTLTILEKTSSSWYYVQLSDGTKGYVSSDYVDSRTTSTSLDLNYVKKQNFINKVCQYHHAGGCIRGLLNRRLDEMEMFFYKDYDIDYGANNYSIKFTCANNPDFHT